LSAGKSPVIFDLECHRCGRLADFLGEVRARYPDYHARPVPAFGDDSPGLVIVGLAPGLHGANRTGRPFTGDFAGQLLYQTLYTHGFASQAQSVAADDPLVLYDCRITNAVKCVPPKNRPMGPEIANCNVYLRSELAAHASCTVILALGVVAHSAVLRALQLKQAAYRFAHAAEHALPDGRCLLDSYHCSRYNTQTKRLTTAMFEAVIGRARQLIDVPNP